MNKTENKKRKSLALILSAVLAVTGVMGGAMAKYITNNQATSTARVARWAFEVNGTDIAKEEFEFDLFSTVDKDTIKKGVNEHIIAPGAEGSMELTLENKSEVAAWVEINFSIEDNTNIPLMFAVVTGDEEPSWTSNIRSLRMAVPFDYIGGKYTSETCTLLWKWDYEQATQPDGDINDTALGTAETLATPTVTIEVEAWQDDGSREG